MRQAFDKGFFMGGALASAMTVTKGKLPPKESRPTRTQRTAPADRARDELSGAGRHVHLRQALVRLRLGQQDARRPAEPHPGRDERPRDVAEMWHWMCPAQVYEVGRRTGTAPSQRARQPVELRPVRRDQRQGRPAHAARRWLGPRVHRHLGSSRTGLRRSPPSSPAPATHPPSRRGRRAWGACRTAPAPTPAGSGRRATSRRARGRARARLRGRGSSGAPSSRPRPPSGG